MGCVALRALGSFQLVFKDGRTFLKHPDYAGPVIRGVEMQKKESAEKADKARWRKDRPVLGTKERT
jgi:hypothetical protein